MAVNNPTTINIPGSNPLAGNVQLAAGANVNLIQNGQSIIISATGGGGGSATIRQIEIDFGSLPVSEASFVVSDTSVSPFSNIIGNVAYVAPTGKDLDEVTMDVIDLVFAPGNQQITIYARGRDGYVADKFKVNYIVG